MTEELFYQRLNESEDRKIEGYVKNPNNKKYLKAYERQAKLDRKSIATIVTNKQKLVLIFRQYVKKDWKKLTIKDFQKIISDIDNNPNFSEKTKSNNKKIIKMFDKFLNGSECSKNTKWIKSSPIKRKLNGLTRDDLITEAEKKKLLNACDCKRDYAIISLWLESGLRPKELRVLTVGSITFDKELAFIDVPQDTKTGSRTIPIYFSKQAILDYLNEHPARDNKTAPLWINTRVNEIRPINMKGFEYVLQKVLVRSGLKKRIYWYLARHTSYTDKVSQGWNEGTLKEFHGIDQSSTVLNRYIHLSGRDLKKKVREYYGLEKVTGKGPELTIIKCLNCKAENPNTNTRCKKCGYIISQKEMLQELKKKTNLEKELKLLKEQMRKNAEVIAKILNVQEAFMKKKGIS